MCVSVQSGCPVGCTFCGTGKKFIRNLSRIEILKQVLHLRSEVEEMEGIDLARGESDKLQVMFMSMGEPMLNFDQVSEAINHLNFLFEDAQLLISTIGINNKKTLNQLLELSVTCDKVGLQFSIHESHEFYRDLLIPYKNKLNLRQIRDYGIIWHRETGRKVYLNYCVNNGEINPNYSDQSTDKLMDLFPPEIFSFTFSVICEIEEGKKSECDMLVLYNLQKRFVDADYNVRIFDPAGKDTIGGGCGQLWYVQEYFKDH
jgi:23S rRNA (adenine2503-C2)-methyltransferase